MEVNIELLLSKLDEKLQQQTYVITTAVTKTVMDALEEKIAPIIEENRNLKIKMSKLEHKLNVMEKDKRKFNLVLFGVKKNEKSEIELIDHVKEIILKSGIHIESYEINNIYRIRLSKPSNSPPIVITLSSMWKKHLILKNKTKLPTGIYIKEDFPKEILEIRKKLQPKVDEERKKGNFAFIKYDKLIVKNPNDNNREKRKREQSKSPNASIQKKSNTNKNIEEVVNKTTKQNIKPNILTYMAREKSTSLTDLPKNH